MIFFILSQGNSAKDMIKYFEMKLLGIETTKLGMNITRTAEGSISVNQCQYKDSTIR